MTFSIDKIAEKEGIRVGLTPISHVGGKAATQIIQHRPFVSMEEFYSWYEGNHGEKKKPDRRSMDSRVIENFDSPSRYQSLSR